MTNSTLSDLFGKETPADKAWRWWSVGVFLLGCFFLFVFEPPADNIIFRCDRATDICTIKKSGFFRTDTTKLRIEEINYARFDPAGWMVRGDHGLDLKLQNGNHIWIGTGSTFFARSKEQQKVKEINNFLTNIELKQILVTHKSFPTAIYAAILLLGGLYSLYKGLRPYVIHGLNNCK
jgi:hypothetical protein